MIKIRAKYLKKLNQKTKGLIGETNFDPVFFNTRFGIHTFLMKKNIDVLILNSKHEVIILKPNLKPNRIFFWNPKFNSVLELKSGSIDTLKISRGDNINIEFL